MSSDLEIKLYFAYTSPFTYLAMAPAYALEQSHRVRLRLIPYGVNIRAVYGGERVDRAERNRSKLRFFYLDARRMAQFAGLTICPPRKIYSARYAFYGGMCAEDQGLFRPYANRVFERFWRRDLQIEQPEALAGILQEVGAKTEPFLRYVDDEEAEAKPRLKASSAEAARAPGSGVHPLG